MFEKYINISELNNALERAEQIHNKKLVNEIETEKQEAYKHNDLQYELDLIADRIIPSQVPKDLYYTIRVCNIRAYNMNTYHNCNTGFLDWKEGTPEHIKKTADLFCMI